MEWSMLKRRIIPIQLLSNGRLVKTRQFESARDVGDPSKSSKVYSDQDADELILLHIDRDGRNIEYLVSAIKSIAEQCFVPLTAGGGITLLQHAEQLFAAGADKVVVNSIAYKDSGVLTSISNQFGRQALVVGIDVRLEKNRYVLYSNGGDARQSESLETHIANVIAAGAGELMIQSIDRDGMMIGYDLDLIQRVAKLSSVPAIVASGAGNFLHLKAAFQAGADAVACGSLFNFGDNNPLRAKAFLKNHGIPLKRI